MSFSNAERAFLTAAHPFELDSLRSSRESGRCVPSSIKMLPTVIASVMVCLIDNGRQLNGTWDRARGMCEPYHRCEQPRNRNPLHNFAARGRCSAGLAPGPSLPMLATPLGRAAWLLAAPHLSNPFPYYPAALAEVIERRKGRQNRLPRHREPPSDYLTTIVPISVPITSPEITSSTRRFRCRPSAVSWEATG